MNSPNDASVIGKALRVTARGIIWRLDDAKQGKPIRVKSTDGASDEEYEVCAVYLEAEHKRALFKNDNDDDGDGESDKKKAKMK